MHISFEHINIKKINKIDMVVELDRSLDDHRDRVPTAKAKVARPVRAWRSCMA